MQIFMTLRFQSIRVVQVKPSGNQYMDALFIPDNPLPRTGTLNDLKQWLTPLLAAEQQA